jgi:hypothetical protein
VSSIRARRGETVLTLDGPQLLIAIGGESFGPFPIDSRSRQSAWRSLNDLSIPLALGDGKLGVGGSSYEVEVHVGGTAVHARWWMSAPPGWHGLNAVFDALAALAPRELATRYDFGRGGE